MYRLKKIMKILYTMYILLVVSLVSSLGAQNLIPSSLYAFDKYEINCGYAGLNGSKVLSLNLREQWLGFDDAPKKYSISYTSPVYQIHGSVGTKISSLRSGISKSIGLDLSYNYVYQSSFGLISFGMGSGIENMKLNKNKIVTPTGFYSQGELNHNDPLIDGILSSDIYTAKMSIFGVYYYNNIEFGIIFDKGINVSDKLGYERKDILRLNWQYIYGYTQDISLKAFGMLYTDFVLIQNDIGIVGLFKNNYLTGVNLRGYNSKSFDSISFLIGGNIDYKLRLIYSYDFTISDLQKVEEGTHEIKIIYNFGKKNIKRRLPPVINNPRL